MALFAQLVTKVRNYHAFAPVIIDLRDNHGGNNPNWFFDWWAPRSYVDDFVRFRIHPDLLEYASGRSGFLRYPDILADYR